MTVLTYLYHLQFILKVSSIPEKSVHSLLTLYPTVPSLLMSLHHYQSDLDLSENEWALLPHCHVFIRPAGASQ